MAGLFLDPWQEDILRAGYARRPDGKWSAFEMGVVVPRQNGKGSALEALELDRLFMDDNTRLILHSAHEMKTAKEAFRRVISLIDDTPLLFKQVKAVRYTNGDEGVELRNGKRLRFVARSTGSGRGFSGDLIVLDEAYNLPSQAMAALLPILSARPNAQLWYTTSAPLLIPQSDFLRSLIKRGRQGESPRLAYFEWCAAPDADITDPDEWAKANPGMGIRISEEAIENELTILSDTLEDFSRERLGIFSEDEQSGRIISAADWLACQDGNDEDGSRLQGIPSFALDVSPDRAWASIAAAGESNNGGIHVELVDRKSGTAWLADRAVELQARWGGKVAIAKGSPAWSLKEDLEMAKVNLLTISTEEHAQACGDVFDAVKERRLRHVGQDELGAAVGGADRRYYGDAWLWSRRTSSVDISPLVAVTLAHWVAQKRKPKPKIQ